MTLTVALAFIAATALLALTPGPNMSLIIANTLAGGLRSGFTTLAGTATGLSILTATAAAGMSSVMVFMAEWFDIIRWVGAIYLIVLGIRQVRQFLRRQGDPTFTPPTVSAGSAYTQGLLVALSNPKVLLFLGAFFPQFVNPAMDPVPQLSILAVLFVGTLLAVDVGYTYVVGRARKSLDARRLGLLDGLAGGLLVAGGVLLATVRKP
jgi:threonine/homoserine/homoserine lactone efflux protein